MINRSGVVGLDPTILHSRPSLDPAESAAPLAELVVETIGTPLVVIDERFRIKTANPAFCTTFHTLAPAEAGLSLFAIDERRWNTAAFRAALVDVFQTSKQFFTSEFEQRLTATDYRVFVVTCRRIDTSSEALLLITFDDVTDRRRMADAVAWHSAELKRSNLELEQFAYVSSHDLQEPLRKIRAYGELLRTEAGDRLDDERADYLKRMVDAAARMQTLINDLLAYSRIATKPPSPKAIDLNKIIDEVRGDLDLMLRETGATVTVAELPQIEADPLQMRQVFQNLIGNALKFARRDAQPAIEITCLPLSPEPGSANAVSEVPVYRFHVSDNGIGFDEQYAETIFTPFQRLHTRKQYAGTGIGLAICRRIIERHGGAISAKAKPGAGATFEFTLPLRVAPLRNTP